MLVQSWSEVVIASLQGLWEGFVTFIPPVVGALLVFIVGWIVAVAFDRVVTGVLESMKIDKAFEQLSFMRSMHEAGFSMKVSALLGSLVKWFFVIAFFVAAVDIVHLTAVADFMQKILFYIPQVIVAVLILAVAALLGEFVSRMVHASLQATSVRASRFASAVARWAIWISAILAALSQLGIASTMVSTLFMGIIAMVALAGGLAFGLGGQSLAKDLLQGIRDDISMK